MECLPVTKLPEGPEWTYEILCGPPHMNSNCPTAGCELAGGLRGWACVRLPTYRCEAAESVAAPVVASWIGISH